jgi:hypothetical protein
MRLDAKVLRFENEDLGLDIKLTISAASVLVGMKRSRLRIEGEKTDEKDQDKRILLRYTYPDLIAPVIEATVLIDGKDQSWPISFDTFLELPDRLVYEWEEIAYGLNPHWLPKPKEEEPEDPKAQSGSTND